MVLELAMKRDTASLNDLYERETARCRASVMRLFANDDLDVIFETNGTTAMALFYHMLRLKEGDAVVYTADGGPAVPLALKGGNPYTRNKGLFPQNMGVLSRCNDDELQAPQTRCACISLKIGSRRKRDHEILDAVREELRNKSLKLVVIPYVTKNGRILPVEDIHSLIEEENARRAAKHRVFYLVDGVQAAGRLHSEMDVMDFCDACAISSSKALGGVLIAGALLMRSDRIPPDCIIDSPWRDMLRLYQFPHQYRAINNYPEGKQEHYAISLPEIVSLSRCAEAFYRNGEGSSFAERRQCQTHVVGSVRDDLVGRLEQIPGLEVLSDQEGIHHVPSIVALDVTTLEAPARVKELLQTGRLGETITLGAMSGRFLRVGIPEYRPVPDLSILVDCIDRAVQQLWGRN